jgi:hypothetical protein
MFLGTIDDNVRRYIAGNREAFAGQTVVVGCSGNFTSEKVILQSTQPAAVHSNDVSLYSLLLADAMLKTRCELTIKEDEYAWLTPYLFERSAWHRVGAVMFMLKMLKHEKQKTVYARRMWTHYLAEFDALVDRTAAKLEGKSVDIASYYNGDIFEHFKRFEQEDAIFTAYLPFFKGDYESQYKRLQQIIGWPSPDYALLDPQRKADILDWMRAPGRQYLFLLNEPLLDVPCQMISHKKRNTWIYLYSNVVRRNGLFRRNYGDSGVRFKLVEPDYRFTPKSKIGLAKISTSDIQYYKGLYLARNIDFTAAEQGFAVLVDDQVFGFLEFSRGKSSSAVTLDEESIKGAQLWYMLSDFPVEPKPHDKLSKLIVMLANTREVRRMLEKTTLSRTRGILTTARTSNPVSMKYRGPMKLVKRGEKDGEPYLNYYADWKDVTCQEVYAEWLKRYNKS